MKPKTTEPATNDLPYFPFYPTENRDGGSRDLCGDLALAAKRPDVLANDLARMGWTDTGDEPDYP